MIRLNTTISVQYIPGKRDLSKNSSKQPLTQPKGEWMIYLMTSKTTGRQYVGVTNDLKARMMNHISDANNPRASTYKTAIATAVRTLGIEDFEIKILDADDDKEYAYNVLERGYIELHKTRELGYNMCSGGIGANGRPVTDEQRKATACACQQQAVLCSNAQSQQGQEVFHQRFEGHPTDSRREGSSRFQTRPQTTIQGLRDRQKKALVFDARAA